MSKRILAFDFGASSGRAMLATYENGKIDMQEIHRFSNDPVYVGDTMHWDILRLWFEIKQGIIKALQLGPVDAIGIDTWGVDFALVDQRGELLGNPVHYRDSRTDGMADEVANIISYHELYTRTGTQTLRFNTIYQLYYLAKYRPDWLERTDKMLFIPDYFAYLLTGEMRGEMTIASTSGFFDPYQKTWDTELLEKLGIPTRILPTLIRPGDVYGTLTPRLCEELGCQPIPVIAACTHDTASAVVAAPASEDEFVYISCGTWSLFGTELKEPCITPESEAVQYTNEGGWDGTIRFLKNIIGLWLIQESRRQWMKEGATVSYADLEREALACEPFKCFIDCDAPEFEIAGDLPGRVREFCRVTGQYVPQTRGEIMRCIYDSLAMKYRTNFEKLSVISKKEFHHIHMLGGGIKDTLLCRLTADATGAKVLAGPVEATVMGNIAVCLISLGELADIKEAREAIANSQTLAVYQPTN
ncbi:MAG: rhamnulokinase, partial [Clostridia bacterium]|nr:rhamnulokinase [Clostridia bacterium]